LGGKYKKYFITKMEIDGEMDAWIDVMDTRRNERIRRGIGWLNVLDSWIN